MIAVLDPGQESDYVLERERSLPESERTTWRLRVLTARTKRMALAGNERIFAEGASQGPTTADAIDTSYRLVDAGVVSWSGKLSVPAGRKPSEFLDDMEALIELSREVLRLCSISAEQQKNSASSPS